MELFEIELAICIKMDLALNNLQRLIWHKTQPTMVGKSSSQIEEYWFNSQCHGGDLVT